MYLDKLDHAQLDHPDIDSFQLDQPTKDKTIKEIRIQNEQNDEKFLNEVENLYNKNANAIKIQPMSFSRSKDRTYMQKHWNSYNYPTYKTFKVDCTNYASQVVHYAGYAKKGSSASAGHHSEPTKWYMDFLGTRLDRKTYSWSNSWSVVHSFYNYWVGHRGHAHKMYKGHKGPSSYTHTGDIIILRDQKSGVWHHTVIDNGRTKAGYVAFSGHTKNRLHKTLYYVNGKKYDFYCIRF